MKWRILRRWFFQDKNDIESKTASLHRIDMNSVAQSKGPNSKHDSNADTVHAGFWEDFRLEVSR